MRKKEKIKENKKLLLKIEKKKKESSKIKLLR